MSTAPRSNAQIMITCRNLMIRRSRWILITLRRSIPFNVFPSGLGRTIPYSYVQTVTFKVGRHVYIQKTTTMKNGAGANPSAGNPILFGIIGTGEIVRMVLPILKLYDGLRVVAIAGTNALSTNLLAKKFGGANVYSDYI